LSYTIVPLTEDTREAYNLFLLHRSDTLLYASLPFKQFLERLLVCESTYFLALDKPDRIVGVLPLMVKDTGIYGKIANSLPFYGSNGGIIVDHSKGEEEGDQIRQALFDAFEAHVKAQDCVASTIITSPFENHQPWYEQHSHYDFVDARIGQVTLLPPCEDNAANRLLQIFEDPRPRNVRKAIKSGIEWYVSHQREDIDFLRKTHQQNIRAIGGLPKEDFFFSLFEKVFEPSNYALYVAVRKGERIAALLLFYFNKTVEYYVPAIVEEYRTLQPLSLLIFKAMEDALRKGYRYWNWGGTWMSQKSLYDFKKRWGSTDFVYHYYTQLYSRDVLDYSGEEVRERYPFFYTVPFRELRR